MNNDLFLQRLKTFSPESVDVLIHYSYWRDRLRETLDLPPFPFDYQPTVIEVFDQQGLLAGRVNDYVYEMPPLPPRHASKFLAWVVDEELAFFCIGPETILNRLAGLSVGALFHLPKKERSL
jgi:hypothetical protein